MVASRDGYVDTVRVLLEAKADPNITDDVRLHYTATVCVIVTWCIMLQDGDTALHYAALYDRIEVIKTLMKYGAAVDIRNKAYIGIIMHIIDQNIYIVTFYVIFLHH